MGRALHLSMMDIKTEGEPVKLASLAIFNDPETLTQTIIDFIHFTTRVHVVTGVMSGINNQTINAEAINLIMQGKLDSIQKIELADRQEFVITLKGRIGNDKHTRTAPRISG